MISFDDAKHAVETLYGSVRGNKFVYQNFTGFGSTSIYSIGANYIFVGCINVATARGGTNEVFVMDINGMGNPVTAVGIDSNGVGISPDIQTLFFMGADYDNGNGPSLIDLTYTTQPNFVSIIGWVFQIDK